MNLIETLKKEINDKKITDKLEIARYIYKKVGNLFKYDPKWYFSTPEEKEELKSKKIDISNVTDNYITNYSWANMYSDLLTNFDITSKINSVDINLYNSVTKKYHTKNMGVNVEVLIDGNSYTADLTKNLNDLISLKFGLPTNYNCRTNDEIKNEPNGNLMNIKNKTKDLKDKLETMKKEEKLNDQEYIYQVYKAIESNVNFSKPNIGFSEGKTYIDLLLSSILGKNYTSNNICFYDKYYDKYISVYIVPVNGVNIFFSYEKGSSVVYKFKTIPKETLDFYFKNYEYILSDNLKTMINKNSNQTVNSRRM